MQKYSRSFLSFIHIHYTLEHLKQRARMASESLEERVARKERKKRIQAQPKHTHHIMKENWV